MDITPGLGTSAVFVLAAIVWLAYLVPVWARRRESENAEREAARLQRTLRALTETTAAGESIELDLRTRDLARTRRLMEKEVRLREAQARAEAVARAREIDEQIKKIEREVTVVVRSSTTRLERLRRTKLACTLTGAAALAGIVVGIAVPGLWLVAVTAALLLAVAVAGLVKVNRCSREAKRVASAAQEQTETVLRESGVIASDDLEAVVERVRSAAAETEEHMRSRVWTPQEVPPQRSNAQSREEYAAEMAERIQEAVRREAAQALRRPRNEQTFEVLVGAEDAVAASRGAAGTGPAAAALPQESASVAPSLSEAAVASDDEDLAFDVRAAFRRRVG